MPSEKAKAQGQTLPSKDEGVEAAWTEEIERRARRVLAGESVGVDWAEARARIASALES